MAREHIHLLGIGGSGMVSLAGLLDEQGVEVSGSDGPLYPPSSTLIEELGLKVFEGYRPENLSRKPDLVVIGNAIRRGNPEAEEVLDAGLPFTSMPRLLSERFLANRHAIVVAGTHGKTTTTAMLAWVLHHAGRDPGFLIGGRPLDFERPFRVGRGKAFVIEGDEYDTAFFDKGPKFMHYSPDTALIGTVEFDHADIYRDLEAVEIAFRRLVNIVPRRGLIVRHEDCAVTRGVTRDALCRVQGYGPESGGWRAVDVEHLPDRLRFRIEREGEPFTTVELQMAGDYNVLNALAVTAAAVEQGLDAEEIRAGLAEFRGVRRRMELRGEADGVAVIDDFAHHPTAIAGTLAAARQRFGDRTLWAVVEPRSWSMRRNVFADRLVETFGGADRVVLAPVFRAEGLDVAQRLDPERVSAGLRDAGIEAVALDGVESIVEHVGRRAASGDVILVMSNGAFGGIHARLLERLARR